MDSRRINLAVWLGITSILALTSYVFGTVYSSKWGIINQSYGALLIATACAIMILGICGALIQGCFIKADYFGLGTSAAIFTIGALTIAAALIPLIVVIFQFSPVYWGRKIGLSAMLMCIPSYALTSVSYFFTRSK